MYHELLSSQTHPLRGALDEQWGGILRSTEVWQDDLGLGFVHDTQEVCSILSQQEEMLLCRDVQLAAHHAPRSLWAEQELRQDAGRLLAGDDVNKPVILQHDAGFLG